MMADPTKPFVLQTDASNVGVGAMLSQPDKTDNEHPVAFYSRMLLDRERRYGSCVKECLAIVEALKHFAIYTLGRPITVQTDHSALRTLQTMKNSNGRLTHWALTLQQYNLVIRHLPGTLNGNADCLSRLPAE